MVISSDDKYLWTCDREFNGHIKQFSVRYGQEIKDLGTIFGDGEIMTMVTTPDNKYLFAASRKGHLKQISLESQQVVHDYGKIHDDGIGCLETTRDSKWLLTGSNDQHIKRFSVEKREFDKDFGKVGTQVISKIKITADVGKLLVGNGGYFDLISSKDGELIKAFGKIHENFMTGIMITSDQKLFFTSSFNGVLKEWNNEDNTLVRDHGKIMDRIWSMCL
jgi:WD40 repeat protein